MISGILTVLFFLVSLPLPVSAADGGTIVASIDKGRDSRSALHPAVAPAVTERYEYYEVLGDSVKDVRCEMDRKGCRWDDGRKYDSVMKWNVKWDYDHAQSAQTCSASSFRTSVDVLYRLPKWLHSDRADRTLLEKWDLYLRRLTLHEQGHRDIAVNAAAGLSRAVDALPPASTCGEIDRKIALLSRECIVRLEAEEKAYDVRTEHGATQGALFP